MALPERVGIGLLFAVIAVLAYVSMIPQLKPWVGAVSYTHLTLPTSDLV